MIHQNIHTGIDTGIENSYLALQSNRMLFKLQTEKFSIEQTIKNLEKKFQTGRIGVETFMKQFRALQSELYLIERKIKQFI